MNPPEKKKKATDAAPPQTISSRRRWGFRLAALLLPFVLLAFLETGLRLAGYGFGPHFFKLQKIGDKFFFVQNDDFSLRFFPRETARSPGALRLRAQKPPGTIRIFILGESAAMGDPEPAYGPARFMEMQLREKFPGVTFEVVNVAFTAINSHVIVPIARECAQHDGDFWIVYMGNNEMVGPFGAATVFGKQAPPLPYVRLVTAIQKTRTGQLGMELARKFRHRKTPATSWGGMQMFLNSQIAPDSPLKENVYLNFEKNLDDILKAGVGAGAKILLNTVAVNLKDCPPFASLPDVPIEEPLRLETNGDWAGAEKLYAQLAAQNKTSAKVQFRWGQNLLAQGDFTAAREHLQRACDDDALPFRTDARENGVIRAAAKKFAGDRVVLLDAAAELASPGPEKMCGEETFYEHVHFAFDGSHRLGLAWAEQLEKMIPSALPRKSGWLTSAECGTRLGLSDWNRVAVLEHMVGRLQVPPLSGQPNNPLRLEKLAARVKDLRAKLNAENAAAAKANFLAQLARTPEDFYVRENFALFLQSAGDHPAAAEEWRRVHELLPHDFLPDYQLGRLLSLLGEKTEAEAQLRMAVKLRPSLTEGWIELGNVLAAQHKFSEALANYGIAQTQRPSDAQIIFRIGKVHALQGDHARAMEFYRDSVQLNPANWEAHYELAGELDAVGQLDAALTEFSAAAQLNPKYSRARFNLGVLLAKHQRLDEAQREFEETLRLEPGYRGVEENLVKIQMLRRKK